jgi:hypothetical protein
MRYHIWTITGAALAMVLVSGELREHGAVILRKSLRTAAGLVVVPTMLAVAARLAG